MINRLKHILLTRFLLTLYNTLILPHVNYRLLLWRQRNQCTHTLPKRTIGTISNSKFNEHTELIYTLFSRLVEPSAYKMCDKIKRDVVLQYFTTIIPTLIHSYFTGRIADEQNRTYQQVIIVYT